ncbi:efflux transporter outer membrane subunit [Tepidicaulis sp. LMO-SS28]|uniref:efflux transporter outer membrane subunit n=1 Tax=Tepidicaulis sp. LMO-SS28 TaxID=3447455 RepID=UPI003EE32229
MERRRPQTVLAALLIFPLTACALTPNYTRPEMAMPAAYESPAPLTYTQTDEDWWAQMANEELASLIARAHENSPTVDAALARIEQARGTLRAAGGRLLPSVDGSANAARSWRDGDDGASASTSDSAGLSVAYELDLFGANRAQLEGAEESLNARSFDAAATRLTLEADVARAYFTVIALKERLVSAKANLAAAEDILRLVRLRYEEGAVSAFDLSRQESATATARARVPGLESDLAAARNALAVLLGETPGSVAVKADRLTEFDALAPELGVPSALLERRPDIQTAEASLRAANADIGVAKAAFYPQVTLSAGATASGLLTNPYSLVSSLAAGLAQPIFSGGELEGGLISAEGRYAELAAAYRSAVLTALQETDDALTTLAARGEQAGYASLSSEQADEAFRLADLQFDAGAIDLLELLDAQRTQLDASDSLVQARLEELSASVDLYRAIGGNWPGAAKGETAETENRL